ncbi:dermonecrotic toxin domain-containing protein [Pseudomonas azerbaijanoccidentalis]
MNTESTIIVASDASTADAHVQHLQNVIPLWLRQAAPHRREALRTIAPERPAGLKDAPPHHHAELGRLIARQASSQNQVDKTLAKLQNPADFAEALLKAELKTRFGLELDVRETFLRLYIPTRFPWLRMKSGAARIWTVSLLDAALHNFENAEALDDAFEPASTYITAPSSIGQFRTLPQIQEKMPIPAFTRLCRELDIGQRYKTYLEANLGISNPVVAVALQSKIREGQRSALTAALHMAQMQNLLAGDAYDLIRGLLDTSASGRSRGQSWGCHDLTLMNARLTGILLFAPDLERAQGVVRVVAYIPGDPEHPIKQYPSSAAFAEELSQRLRDPDYQQFFSRFIAHDDRGHFFAQLNNQLAPITWQPVQPGDPRPTWRDAPNPRPDLHLVATPIKGQLWTHLYQCQLDKILNDARVIAVSTATVDQKARWALWDSFAEIASALLNAAAFIALPFVPFLGEVMMAYIAYQLLDETFESVVDWAQGQTREAFGHFMGVVESAVQLGTFAAGGVIVASEFRALLPREIVQFFDRFDAVKKPNGETRYLQHDRVTEPKRIAPDTAQLPPLQADTLKRFKIDHDIQTFIEQIGSEQAEDYLQADPVTQFELLHENGYWPADKGLRLIDGSAQILWQSPTPDVPVLQLDVTHLNDSDLLKTFLEALSENETRTLMGKEFSFPAPRLENHTRSLRRTLAQLARRKRKSLFEQRYRKLERGARAEVQTLIDAEPGLPTSVAEAIAGTADELELQQLKNGRISPRLSELVQEAGLQVRVTRAYEGLELPSTEDNLDTDRLALHTLANLPGWTGETRLELRHYGHEGALIDSLGNADAPVRKVLVLSEEGSYQAHDHNGEELSGLNTLYASLLQALPDSERSALDIHIGEGERLKQLIRQHALSRDAVRALLTEHPNFKPTYDPEVMRLLGGGDGYLRMPINTPTLQARAQALFPHLSAEELESFVLRLQQHPRGPRAELHRLTVQYTELFEKLSDWRDEIPLFVPDSQTRLTTEQFATQKQVRQQFMIDLLDCWRRQWTVPESGVETLDFSFFQAITGELPTLSADFSGVTTLRLEGSNATRGMHEFLKSFPGLRELKLRYFNLGRLPDLISSLPLKQLILTDCAVTLSPESHAMLAGLHELTILDLYKNPLGMTPDISGMPDLNYVDLSQTGITDLPHDLLSRPRLRTALLNDNQIKELPSALFTLQRSTQEGFDLGNNPLSTATRERLKQHFQQTRQDLGVYADATEIQRVQVLYPMMDQEDASKFVYLLPGSLTEGRVALTNLEAEFTRLENDLAAWTADIPAIHPLSNQPFNAQQVLIEHSTRDEFKQGVLRCWRRETEPDDFSDLMQKTYDLSADTLITGDLPILNANFSHVSLLYLNSDSGLTTGVTRFLECFPNLKTISIRDFLLDDLPEAIFRMRRLKSLNLPDCNITLTAKNVLSLAEMTRLEFIDLSGNPLGLVPDVSQMTELATLQLDHCGLTELPPGLLQSKSLETADLSGNAITRVPSDILELPMEIAESINLRGNPFSEESLKFLIEYFRLTHIDFGVQAVIERAELEVSTSEASDAED